MKKSIVFGLILFIVIGFILISKNRKNIPNPSSSTNPPSVSQNQSNKPPKITSTKPDPLDEIIIPADQIIEISFNRPLQNAPEFKVRMDPKIDFKVELSSDKKTARIIPVKPYELGTSYTLYIGPDTKFDGVGEWRQDKTFRFRTIRYRGI